MLVGRPGSPVYGMVRRSCQTHLGLCCRQQTFTSPTKRVWSRLGEAPCFCITAPQCFDQRGLRDGSRDYQMRTGRAAGFKMQASISQPCVKAPSNTQAIHDLQQGRSRDDSLGARDGVPHRDVSPKTDSEAQYHVLQGCNADASVNRREFATWPALFQQGRARVAGVSDDHRGSPRASLLRIMGYGQYETHSCGRNKLLLALCRASSGRFLPASK
jgi:hypothetical protein